MNRSQIKKRIAVLGVYRDKVSDKADLAKHLLDETRSRRSSCHDRIEVAQRRLESAKVNTSTTISSGTLQNTYLYGQSLDMLICELQEELRIIDSEFVRRQGEYRSFRLKVLGVESLIEKLTKEIALLEQKEEGEDLDEWVTSRFAKSKGVKVGTAD